MTEQGKRPISARIWLYFGGMIVMAVVCFAIAIVLASHGRNVERSGAHEGYAVVLRADKDKRTEAVDAQNLALLMSANFSDVSGSVAVSASESEPVAVKEAPATPMDLPAMPLEALRPTELPPEEGAKPEAFPARDVSPLAVVAPPEDVTWKRNAIAFEAPAGKPPMMALVIDDMGGRMEESRMAVENLPAPVTLSFFPWSREGIVLAHTARAAGHEIMIHMPMEALPHASGVPDPGPDTLRVGMTPDEIDALLERNIARLSDIAVGMNNHMGSRFTGWEEGMRAVLTVLQRHGMLFLDSKTSAPTAVAKASAGLVLPVLARDVFLDHTDTPEAVRHELQRAATLARKHGQVVVIGHPLPVTLGVLHEELPKLVSSGIVLVPLTALVK